MRQRKDNPMTLKNKTKIKRMTWKDICALCGVPLDENWKNIGMADAEKEVAVCRECNKKVHKFYDIDK